MAICLLLFVYTICKPNHIHLINSSAIYMLETDLSFSLYICLIKDLYMGLNYNVCFWTVYL